MHGPTRGERVPVRARQETHIADLDGVANAAGEPSEEIVEGIDEGAGARIMGRKSSEIEGILGFRGRHEMVHRDNLVLVRNDAPPIQESSVRVAQ